MGKKTIGIIGGMGPVSGITLFNNIIQYSEARKDQDHIPVLIASIPHEISDRTAFILTESSVNPGYAIAKQILNLEAIGASLIAICCNTAHSPCILNLIENVLSENKSKVKIINLVDNAVDYVINNINRRNKIGILSTYGAFRTEIYINDLTKYKFNIFVPDDNYQKTVIHKIIYNENFGIKAHPLKIKKDVYDLINKVVDYYISENVEYIILGCTEFSSVFCDYCTSQVQIIDPIQLLAKTLVSLA